LAQADDEELAGGIRLQADQVEQGEVGQRSAVGVGGVLGDRQVDLVTQDAAQHVVAFRRGGHDYLCVVGRVLVRGVGVGFGCPAPGVWISTYTGRAGEAEQVLKEAGVRPGAQVFLAGHLAGGELPAPVGQAWDLDGLGREYEAFVAEFTGYRSGDPLMRLARLVHAWRRFRLVDPTLPAELLPAGWSGIRAARLFHRQHERWRPAAMAEWRRLCR
jgi:PaaX-like protein C-terminal domain